MGVADDMCDSMSLLLFRSGGVFALAGGGATFVWAGGLGKLGGPLGSEDVCVSAPAGVLGTTEVPRVGWKGLSRDRGTLR